MQWIERRSVVWSSAWYGDPCHTVAYPDGREVCIHCSNPKPQHSAYVFSADWFQTFECKWVCNPGHTGPNCEVPIDTALYAASGMFVVMCMSGILLVAMYGRNLGNVVLRTNEKAKKGVQTNEEEDGRPAPEKETKPQALASPPVAMATPRAGAALRSEVITFKDSNVIGEIRIKLL